MVSISLEPSFDDLNLQSDKDLLSPTNSIEMDEEKETDDDLYVAIPLSTPKQLTPKQTRSQPSVYSLILIDLVK